MKQDITEKKQGIDLSMYDSIVIKKHITDIEGGRTLDMTGYPLDVLYAGHVIISKTTTEAGVTTKTYAPMPLVPVTETTGEGQNAVTTNVTDADGNIVYQYGTLPQGAVYEGVLYRSILKDKPAASILIDGVVNDKVMKYELGAIASAFKTACPHIIFNHDEEA